MICAHCGTLIANGSERCGHCGRPLLADRPEVCATHPDRAAVTVCAICDAPLCESCVVRVAGSAYCGAHAEDTSSPMIGGEGASARPVVNLEGTAPATFADRVLAGALDLSLIGAYLFILYLVLWSLSGSPPTLADAGGWRVTFWLLAFLGPIGYLCWENADNGQTVGKSATDLTALREDGTLMDARTGVLRGLYSAVGFLLGGVGFWYMLWSPDHRALHDRILGAVVVKTQSE